MRAGMPGKCGAAGSGEGMRQAGQVKLGYYPTPEVVVDRLRTFMQFPGEEYPALDPCCGCGAALAGLLHGTQGLGYGVELDGYRARESSGVLHRVVRGAWENAVVAREAFSICLLNPPYDFEGEGERDEKVFLQTTHPHLVAGGVLIYIIPQPRLSRVVARILAYRFEDLRVYRFPRGEYEVFRQIVVLGVKRRAPVADDELFRRLVSVPDEDLPELPCAAEPLYAVPAAPSRVRPFRGMRLTEDDVREVLVRSSLYGRARDLCQGLGEREGVRPPLPLRQGHIGLMLASGHLDGEVGEGGDLHLVRGRVVKETVPLPTENENEEREMEVFRVSVVLLDATGDVRTLV